MYRTLTPLVSRDPDMDYLEYSDSDGGESIANESEYPSSTAQSLFSVSEMDAADEAEEDTEFEELAKKKQQEMTAALASTKKVLLNYYNAITQFIVKIINTHLFAGKEGKVEKKTGR